MFESGSRHNTSNGAAVARSWEARDPEFDMLLWHGVPTKYGMPLCWDTICVKVFTMGIISIVDFAE